MIISRSSACLPASSALLPAAPRLGQTTRSSRPRRSAPVCGRVSPVRCNPADKGPAGEHHSEWLVVSPTDHCSQFASELSTLVSKLGKTSVVQQR